MKTFKETPQDPDDNCINDCIGNTESGCRCEIDPHKPDTDEQIHITRLEQMYLGKAVKTKHGWSVIKRIYGAGKCKRDNMPSFWTIGELIWRQEHSEHELLKYRVRLEHYDSFFINDDDTLYEDEIDENFENIKDEIYDYAAEVNDQNGVHFSVNDSVVCIDNGKLKKCEVRGFDPETYVYTLKCYRTDEILYRRGPEILLVEYYGC